MKRPSALVAFVAALVLGSPAALASHNADEHSANMSLVANWNDGGKYRQGSDLAFWGNLAILGNYDNPGGFRVLNISNPANPRLVGRFNCPGRQSDVSVWKNLVFVSVDTPRSDEKCGSPASTPDQTLPGTDWEGIRIVSIANPAKPVQIGTVRTDCGSHTHTLVPDLGNRINGKLDPRVLLYVESYPLAGQGQKCNVFTHRKISVVQVPLQHPRDAKVVSTPSVDPAIGCHDVTVLPQRDLAAAACITESQIWDISDPANPEVIAHIYNPLINIHHSSAFSWDGNTLVIGDEMGGADAAFGCLTAGHAPLGALWFYDVSNPTAPVEKGFFELPQVEASEFCTAHNFNVVPLEGDKDILVSAWYNGGTTVVDFTDPANPTQLGYYIPKEGVPAGAWSSYWYNGFIYVNNFDQDQVFELSRGFDVLQISDPALSGAIRLSHLNAQTQEPLP